MSSIIENIDNLTTEEYLGPPKYDAVSIFMSTLAALIVGFISGVFILILAYFIFGGLFLETASSPILFEIITFFSLVIGNTLYYIILSKIFPHIYSRGRTALIQIGILSILLYILFFPVYMSVSVISSSSLNILAPFSAHVIINIFTFGLTIGIISQYRYSLLVLYVNIIALLITSMLVIYVVYNFQDSSKAIFILLGLTLFAYLIYGVTSSLLSYIYYRIYVTTGMDVLGDIFSRIENEEKEFEKQAVESLTHFSKK